MSEPLDDDELARLDDVLLNRTDDETADSIAAAQGDEGIIDVSELDGFLTALTSGPDAIAPSRWLPGIFGEAEPVWESAQQFQEIFGLIVRHQNSIAATLLHDPQSFEPMFEEREVDGKTYAIFDEWCHGYMRGVALDIDAWNASEENVGEFLRPIRLRGTEEGWRKLESMPAVDRAQEQDAISQSARMLYNYWLERRAAPSAPIRRASSKVGRNDPCICGSGKKYKYCCLQ